MKFKVTLAVLAIVATAISGQARVTRFVVGHTETPRRTAIRNSPAMSTVNSIRNSG